MELVSAVAEARKHTELARKADKSVGFVPTMGALHEGHLNLIRACKRETWFTTVSLFVNPTQFGPTEDYRSYPSTLEDDLDACSKEKVDLVFAPTAAEMYPDSYGTYVIQERLTERLCGKARPGHFNGVCTVLAKLFNIIRPDIAYFGQKDYQQTVVVRRLVADLNIPVEIRVLPTVREPDGLAISSRNRYLGAPNSQERQAATCLYRALQRAEEMVAQGEMSSAAILHEMTRIISETPRTRLDYAAIVDPDTLEDVEKIRTTAVAALAVHVGPARLIDNTLLNPRPVPAEGPFRKETQPA